MKYPDNVVWKIWAKAEIFAGNDPVFWRRDLCGAWIFRGDYENTISEYGWVIDYIKPLDKGGTDDISNLYPFHWSNTSRNQNGEMICKMTAAGIHNNTNTQKTLQETIAEYQNSFF